MFLKCVVRIRGVILIYCIELGFVRGECGLLLSFVEFNFFLLLLILDTFYLYFLVIFIDGLLYIYFF